MVVYPFEITGYLEIDWNECDVMNRFSGSHVLVDRYCTHTFERVFCLEEEGPRPLTTDVTSLQKGEADTRCTEDRVRVSTSAAACGLRENSAWTFRREKSCLFK